ncbi:MAG: hypothetical protein K0S65_92 [Labilithrix sp.]|nr:hypothetical protein [Labilithrix sp.]
MTATQLQEAGGKLRTAESGLWAATLLTPGNGSSGFYADEMLEQFAAVAFPKGTKLWFGHPKEFEGPGDRDPRDQWGFLEEDAEFVAGEGIVGKIRLLAHWKEVVESIGDQASLSIYAMGEHDEDGNVSALLAHRTNSVDMVGYPGRVGSGLKKKIEAARAASDQPGAASASGTHNQEVHMDPETKAAIESLKTSVDAALVELKAATDAARQAEADAKARTPEVSDAVDAAVESLAAISKAGLVDEQAEPIIEAAKRGEDITAELEKAVKLKAAIEAAAKPEVEGKSSLFEGYVHESVASDGDDFSLGLGRSF